VSILARIESLEERIVNAATIETARRLHDELDELRALAPVDAGCEETYRRGYQAGYQTGVRRAAEAESAETAKGPA
jgi:hypothetical protein